MYEITEHEKRYVNQTDAMVVVSFQLPLNEWNLLKTSIEWRLVEKMIEKMGNQK